MEKISVRKIFKDKNPKLARLIPGFLYRYLEKVIHQKDINNLIPVFEGKMGLDFVQTAIDEFNIKINIHGEENIPQKGRYIFVANHPLGGFDGIVFAHVVGKYHPDIKFLVNDILMNLKNLDPIFIPVNKHGRQSLEYVKRIEKTYESDAQVLNFPAGLCSRKIKGQIIDLEWKKSFISKAIQHQRDIVPVHIDGRNSNFFYNLSNIRKKLGIKANLEMLYLADELFKQRNKVITLTFGQPISHKTLDQSKTPKQWAKEIKKYVYRLPKGRIEPFQ
ncbi:MAG: 1-acyl-sn-glycerol-3-phosphate acyltransferase [Bacteroidales bacterium]|jgi:putative hemolysin|nr:1-acyl-sn-glycerol-3-phosphate acyltransferase [Bacteroidales bacterium]